ncbi:hypothetical protein NONI108955_44445 [Nocardia ninae]|uniref:Uncharacterized protein n=1 Tax=Nocardia ninae NBRC 108245 TaxID=1210091 RepID=A0A511MJQ5_9NOCA|nr:hypothetical protein [Nocardia ninae]GEM40872.1 hypothetical protein NN4_53910 [Nocardia ninae NBRC 108245]
MKSIFLKWKQQSEHGYLVNVPDDFELEDVPYGVLRNMACCVAPDVDTYENGYEYAFEAEDMEFDPDAVSLF